MNNRKFRSLVITLLALTFCLLAAAIVGLAAYLPQATADRFGPASPDLYWWENIYYSVQLLAYENDLTNPYDAIDSPAMVNIELGEPVASIAQKLASLNLITNPQAFQAYLAYSGLDRTLQAGDYRIDPGWNTLEIARRLQDATPTEITFSILAGWRIEEIAASLPTSGLSITPEAFLQAARSPAEHGFTLPQGWPPGASLEGVFLPGQYTFPREATLEELIRFFVSQFDLEVGPELTDAFARQGLVVYEALILASMVEREAMIEEEEPMVASVFLNRYQAGMRFESDPTVQYALGYHEPQQTWWKNPLSLPDLSIESAYNTYKVESLPPGPICSPALSALRAVAFPAQTSYLYFRAACDGSGRHLFAITFEEHLQNGCQ